MATDGGGPSTSRWENEDIMNKEKEDHVGSNWQESNQGILEDPFITLGLSKCTVKLTERAR
jgi:hypothetical protein